MREGEGEGVWTPLGGAERRRGGGGRRERGHEPKQPDPGSFYTCRQRNQKPKSIEGFKIQRMTRVLSPSVIHAGKSSAYIILGAAVQDHSHWEGTKVLESKSIEWRDDLQRKRQAVRYPCMRNSARKHTQKVTGGRVLSLY